MPLDFHDRLTDALGKGHDSDTAKSYARGCHHIPRIEPRMLSTCCNAEECTDRLLLGRCEECGNYAKFYIEGDE